MNEIIKILSDPGLQKLLLGSTILGTIFSASMSIYKNRRKYSVELYSTGIKLISERAELYYKVMRRNEEDGSCSSEKKRQLIDELHTNQSRIFEHKALLMTDSWWLGKSYSQCWDQFSKLTAQKFRDAWDDPLQNGWNSVPADKRISTDYLLEIYAKDCRRRINPVRNFLAKLWYSAKEIVTYVFKLGKNKYER